MKDKLLARVTAALADELGQDERIEVAVQALVTPAPAQQSKLASTASEVSKFVSPKAAARSEGYAVLTSQRLVCLGKSIAQRPTSEVTQQLARLDFGSVEYKRGLVSRLTVWPTGNGDGIMLTFGRLLRGQADELHAALTDAGTR